MFEVLNRLNQVFLWCVHEASFHLVWLKTIQTWSLSLGPSRSNFPVFLNSFNVTVWFCRLPYRWPRWASSNMEPMKKKQKRLDWWVRFHFYKVSTGVCVLKLFPVSVVFCGRHRHRRPGEEHPGAEGDGRSLWRQPVGSGSVQPWINPRRWTVSSRLSGQDPAERSRKERDGDSDQRRSDHPEGHRRRQPGRQSSGWWVTTANVCSMLTCSFWTEPGGSGVFADMSKVQDDEVGDGTTSVTVLAAELLRVSSPTWRWPVSWNRSLTFALTCLRRRSFSSPGRSTLRPSSRAGGRPLRWRERLWGRRLSTTGETAPVDPTLGGGGSRVFLQQELQLNSIEPSSLIVWGSTSVWFWPVF